MTCSARSRRQTSMPLRPGMPTSSRYRSGLTVLAKTVKPDLYLLGVGMPGLNGIEVCRRLRAEQVITPILMLTGFGAEEDKVAGLEAGADDYQTKPFASKELLARVNALLRRSSVYAPDASPEAFITGDLRVDFDQHLAFKS